MENLNINSEFFQKRNLKSFIKVGQTFIDIKQTIGFSFLNDPDGYIIIQFVYESGRALNAFLRNRNDFAQFLLELEPFIDDKIALSSLEELINDIEKTFNKNSCFKTKKFKNSRKGNKDKNNSTETK